MNKKDITNKKFGRLTAKYVDSIHTYPNGEKTEVWVCECECGNQVKVFRKNLLNGNSTSCGCLRKESNSRRLTKHGGKGTRLYEIWCSIKYRCLNKNCSSYDRYGGRGITICEEWIHDFVNFREWSLENGYNESLTIDRIDVNGNYEPSNCRWVDMTVQANNRTNTIYITYNNETHTCAEWAKITGINYDTLNNRYNVGMTPEEILYPEKHSTHFRK